MSRVGVVGAGYVGLTTAACLAHLGHDVACGDVDVEKLAALATGRHQGLFHVTNQGACTWHELAGAALELAGLDVTVGETTAAALGRPAPRPANSVLADTALGGAGIPRLRPWREALAEKLTAGVEVRS